MANIHVNRGEIKLGVLSVEEIQEGLRSGRFLPGDLGWREGMATWQPLAEFPEFAGVGPSAPAPLAGSGAALQDGLPWDRRQQLGFFPAFFETLKLVLLNPTVAFASMKREGGMSEPLIYAVTGGSVGFFFYLIFSVFMSSFGIMSDRNPLAGMVGLGFGLVIFIIFIPVLVAVGLFIGSGILHLCLMLVGGAKRSYETTFRVLSFSIGSAYPLLIVPVCGGLISGIWCIVLECIGLARAHETETGRAVIAVLLPVLLCCLGGMLFGIMFGTLGALMGSHH